MSDSAKGLGVEAPQTTPLPDELEGVESTRPVAGRRAVIAFMRSRTGLRVSQVALLILILVAWENLSGDPAQPGTLIDSYYVSRPSAVLGALVGWWEQGILWQSILATVKTASVGFLLGVGFGMLFGFVFGVSPYLSRLLDPFVNALYSIPRLALIPLFMLWLGIGEPSRIALVVSVVAFLVFYSTYAGVRSVDRELIDRLRLMRARRWQVYTKVTLPAALAQIIAGFRISAPYALVVAVTAEMIQSNRGMGYLLIRSSGQFFTAGVFAAIVIMMVLGMVLLGLIQLLEDYLLRWQPDRDAPLPEA